MADYSEQWRDYRTLRGVALTVMGLTFALVLMAVTFFRPIRFGSVWLTILMALGSGLFGAAMVTGVRAEHWKCPRCGRRFVSKWSAGLGIFFAKSCANYGLAKFANN